MADQEIKISKYKYFAQIDTETCYDDSEWKVWIDKAIEDFYKSRDLYIRNKLIELGWTPPDE